MQKFGLKEKIISSVVGVVLTSGIVATAAINPFDSNTPQTSTPVVSEESIMESTTSVETTSIDLSPIESAVSEGIEKINSATDEAIGKIQSTTQETQKVVSSEQPVLSKTPEPKTMPLDIVSETDVFKLIFKSVRVNYEYKSIEFKYDLTSTASLMFDYANFKCVDKSGKELKHGAIGGTIGWNSDRTEFIGYDCHMGFYGFDDPANIETVILTYAFEGYDPVTLTIDIPLETTE